MMQSTVRRAALRLPSARPVRAFSSAATSTGGCPFHNKPAASGSAPIAAQHTAAAAAPAAPKPIVTPPGMKPFNSIPGPTVVPEQGGTIADFGARLQKFGPYGLATSLYKDYGMLSKQNFMGKEEVWLFDPEEAMKVFRNEGKFPIGAASDLWPFNVYFEDAKLNAPLTKVGPEWKRMRNALQKDMFTPQSAATYLPIINSAARTAVDYVDRVERFTDLAPFASMDMFTAVMLGYCPKTVTSVAGVNEAHPGDVEFAMNSMTALGYLGLLLMDPSCYGNRKDPRYVTFAAAMDKVLERARVLVGDTLKQIQQNPLPNPDDSSASYFARVISRGEITPEEAVPELCNLVFAGVDTTTHVLQWFVLQLALNPDKQQKLREEVQRVVGDRDVTADDISDMTYLNNCMREAHRITPPSFATTFRYVAKDVDLAGYHIPSETKINISTLPVQHDPNLVPNVDTFLPERWDDAEVAKRKGTRAELIDHMLCRRPFSFGARMCLGARVAELEIKTMIAHLVRKWRFEESPKNQKWTYFMQSFVRADPFPTIRFQRV